MARVEAMSSGIALQNSLANLRPNLQMLQPVSPEAGLICGNKIIASSFLLCQPYTQLTYVFEPMSMQLHRY